MNQLEMSLEPLRGFLISVGEFLPRIVLALLVLLAGWIIAKMVRFAIARGPARGELQRAHRARRAWTASCATAASRPIPPASSALLFYWLVILASLVIGFNLLGLDLHHRSPRARGAVPAQGDGRAAHPRLRRLLRALHRQRGHAPTAANVHIQDADLLGRLAQYAIVTFVVLIALDQVNVGGDIVRQTFLIVLAGVVFALALAFGLGGKDWAAEMLERWWPRRK